MLDKLESVHTWLCVDEKKKKTLKKTTKPQKMADHEK